MAYRIPPFRSSFPMMLASGLLLAQPMTSLANDQVECRASSDGSGWICSPLSTPATLPPRPVRSEPPRPAKAETRPVDETFAPRQASQATPPSAQPTPFSELDWVPREQLDAAQLAAIAPYCGGTYIEPERAGRDDETPFSELPIHATADSSRFEQSSQIGVLQGDVVLRQGRLQAQSNTATYDRTEDLVRLEGNVRLRDQGVLMIGDEAQMRVDTGETRVDRVQYVVHDARARGTGDKVMRRDDAVIVMTNGTYTTCEPGENTWSLHAKDIELNREEGWGEAKHVRLHVKDVPVFYTPYFNFPLDDRRKSGFLAPSYENSTDNGNEITIPYYFNLAPNYDATLYPRLMSKRGALIEGEVRHMSRLSQSQLNAAFLDDSEFGEQRWMYHLRHGQSLTDRLSAQVDTADMSDPYYFHDLSSALESRPDDYVNQRASMNYAGDTWRLQALVHGYELATVTALTPYERLPQLQLDGGNWLGETGLRLDYSAQYSNFDRELRAGTVAGEDGVAIGQPDVGLSGLQRATGHRVNVSPALSYPIRNSWGFIIPKTRLESTHYDLEFDERVDSFDYANADRTPSTTVPVTSLDTGLYFDRDTSWFGNDMRQTLEPRAFYVYAPYKEQSDQPLFDTNETTFSYNSLYRDDRFSGGDRVGDSNQVTLGATSRFLDDAGRERMRGSLGQIFYLNDRRVQLTDIAGEPDPRDSNSNSAYAAEFMYQMHDDWRLSSNLLWDPDDSNSNAGDVRVNYQPEPRKAINVGYRFRNELSTFNTRTGAFENTANDKIDQSDLSFMWPLSQQWSVIGRWQHDFVEDRTLEAMGGLEYDSCCWKLRIINRYWVDYDEYESLADDEPNRGIFLQVVLNGLGSVTGNRVETLLSEGIPGYRERENNAF